MKKIFYIATFAVASLFATSCEDYLTVESPDQLSSSSFWRNEADAEAGLAAAYSQLEYFIDTWGFAEIKWPVEAYREDIIDMGNDARNYPNWVELYNFTYTNGNSQFTEYWDNNYRGISFSNQVIEKVAEISDENISPAKREQIVAEAHFLRAYYHLKLQLNWEKIVVRDEYITNQDQLNKPLSERSESWDLIISDLTKATSLPATHTINAVGRATKGAAYAYLGFAYLTRSYEESAQKSEYLTKAIEAFNNVTGYELESNFGSMFNATNKNSSESIFELQTSMSSANGANYRSQMHRWIGVSELSGWDEILPSRFLMESFKSEGKTSKSGEYDARLYASVFFQDEYFNDNSGKVYGKNYDDLFQNSDGVAYDRPAFRKFMPADANGLNQNYCAINIPLMRYSNVLLMKAEALNESGSTAQAITLINEVRDVHGNMPAMSGTTQDAVRAQIEHERIIEFPLENWRWYDLRRWGKQKEAMTNVGRSFDVSKNSFYPIPLSEINSNSEISK